MHLFNSITTLMPDLLDSSLISEPSIVLFMPSSNFSSFLPYLLHMVFL
ncbi:MAG: hypothetical protein U1E31_00350 [Rickettsiales bacterium]